MNAGYLGNARRGGRTQWMIDRLVEAIVEGQPLSFVVGHNWHFATQILRPRVIEALEKAGIPVHVSGHDRLDCDGSTVVFTTADRLRDDTRGTYGSEFWDHAAESSARLTADDLGYLR